VIVDDDVVPFQPGQVVYVMTGGKKTNIGSEIDIVSQSNVIAAVIGWKELHATIDCNIVTGFDQPWVFDVNVVIKEYVFPATVQHEPESEVPNKRRHQVHNHLHEMYGVSEDLVEYSLRT
jgi:hypothetical protein